MKCRILHETKGRLRVHLCIGRMTLRQADLLEYSMRAVDGVASVKVYDRTQDAVIEYCEVRSAVLAALSSFSFAAAEEAGLVPEHTGRALNREFEDKLVWKTALHYACKLFLPAYVRAASPSCAPCAISRPASPPCCTGSFLSPCSMQRP